MTAPIDRTTRPAERLPATQLGQIVQQSFPGERVVERDPAGQVPDASTDGDTVADNVEPEHTTCAGGRVQKPEQQPDGRALPGAVRSQEAEDLAFMNRDVERLERLDRRRRLDERQAERQRAMPVVFRQPARRDGMHRGECSARPCNRTGAPKPS